MTRFTRIEFFGVIGAGAVGAGVHAAIAPEHLREWAPLGASFVAMAILFAAAVAALALDPTIDVLCGLGKLCSQRLQAATS